MYLNQLINIFVLFFIVPVYFSFAQMIGGSNTFEFLNLNTSPRIIALGDYAFSVTDDDLNTGIYNPATINHLMHNSYVLNYTDYYSDVIYGNIGASFKMKDHHFITSMKFIDYGSFIETNEFGQEIGLFSAGEYLFSLGSSQSVLDSLFSIGINAKVIYSSLYELSSLGCALDMGVIYDFTQTNLTASILIKNLGYQIIPYYDGNRESIPFEIAMGFSSKLKYMPLRWHLAFQHIETPDLIAGNVLSDHLNNDHIGYNILSHIVFGAELLLHKNVNLLFGYNNRTRFEMLIEDRKGLVGFSCGFLVKINRFSLAFSRASHHLSGPINSFGISTNLKKIE